MHIRHLGLVDCQQTASAMQDWTAARLPDTPDQLWLCQHPRVYTLGAGALPEHILHHTDIPVVRSTRGGQVTYHGPGQVVAYPLVDLRRRKLFVKDYVARLEEAAVRTLADFGIAGLRVPGAPGVYVRWGGDAGAAAQPAAAAPFHGLAKIAALGIKVTNGYAYHGLALNVAMDLHPFAQINPCGYAHLVTCDMRSLGVHARWLSVADTLSQHLQQLLCEGPQSHLPPQGDSL